MSYLKFDKNELVNLEYSLQREYLRTNRSGAYSSSTLVGCNTRKYHGLLIVKLSDPVGGKHVLLSSLDETVIQHDSQFNLGIHKYPGDFYEPKGHKYIRNFEFDTIPKMTYRVGGVLLTKTMMLVEDENQVIVKYTLEDAHSPTILRFKPFLAFRNVHELSKVNMAANSKYIPVKNGIKIRLYEGYPELYMQFSKAVDFVPVPDWYLNIEYMKEQARGYDYQEDLLVPGYFEMSIKKGEEIFFSASTTEHAPKAFKSEYSVELKRHIPRNSFTNCLLNAAQQFIWVRKDGKDIIAGFPWYESIPRQTLSALPGLLLTQGKAEIYEEIIQANLKSLKNGLLPKYRGIPSDYDAADAPLLVFAALQELKAFKNNDEIWSNYGSALKEILVNYRKGTHYNIHMQHDGLIYAKQDGVALTWMDAYIDGRPVTQRGGLNVEINAAWFNAVCFALELAEDSNDKNFTSEWKDLPSLIGESFLHTFWSDEQEYLADYVDGNHVDWSVRPNMIIATSFEYSPLLREQKKMIVSLVRDELLTPKGLRTLAPANPNYKGLFEDTPVDRAAAAHQGSVYPYLIHPFIKSYLDIHKAGGLHFVKELIKGFEVEMEMNCIGTLSEVYEGNPPYTAQGAISQAWNVGSILSTLKLIEKIEDLKKESVY